MRDHLQVQQEEGELVAKKCRRDKYKSWIRWLYPQYALSDIVQAAGECVPLREVLRIEVSKRHPDWVYPYWSFSNAFSALG